MEPEQQAEYEQLMAQESLFVGAGNVAAFMIVQKALPNMSPLAQVFIAGVLFHLTAEYSGLNEWYLTHGAAALGKGKGDAYDYVEENLYSKKDYRCGRSDMDSWDSAALSLCIKY
jgi:hypothetical protein